MISYTQGNLLEANVEALVNTVNTVGVMGKGIALMFKERFPSNMREYASACKVGNVNTGRMFVTETQELLGPRWIVNFPTKQHWRDKSQIQWVKDGLEDLKRFIDEHNVRSIAIPPLGAGNGGLDWPQVRLLIEEALAGLQNVDIVVYEPTTQYQNIAKRQGVEKLTPARALIAELVRQYWVLGMECSLLEIHKLGWFLERELKRAGLESLHLSFVEGRYGPYSDRLRHLLTALDGSYLHCQKRISDCQALDVIWFDDAKHDKLTAYLNSEAKAYLLVLERVSRVIDGFESPFGLELLATVDCLLLKKGALANDADFQQGLKEWPAGKYWGERKLKLFSRHFGLAAERLREQMSGYDVSSMSQNG